MKKLMVNVRLPEEALEPFQEHFDVVAPPDQSVWSRADILERIPDCDAMLCLGFLVDRECIDAAKNLKVVGVVGVGYDNVDVKYASEKNILVINTPQEVMHATAELTIAIMLDAMRCTVSYDRELRQTLDARTPAFVHKATLAYGKTLGIIGFGRIGKAVAEKAHGLGMKIIYSDVVRASEDFEAKLGAQYLPIEKVISSSDVLTLHCPYTTENHHLISIKELNAMKPSAYLVNAARGPIVDEAALIQALKDKTIRGAALDVFEFEPKISEEMARRDNIVIVPHIGAQCFEVRVAMCHESLTGIVACLDGKVPYNAVNPEIARIGG